MHSTMIERAQSLKIHKSIVDAIAVDMVHLEARRHGAVGSLPYDDMLEDVSLYRGVPQPAISIRDNTVTARSIAFRTTLSHALNITY
jgi:hypothetical protein